MTAAAVKVTEQPDLPGFPVTMNNESKSGALALMLLKIALSTAMLSASLSSLARMSENAC